MTTVQTVGEVSAEALTALRGRIRGQVIAPGDGGYDEARRVWNGMIDRRPGAIVRCSGTADVAIAVRVAREHDLAVSIRGGGHNVAGKAVCDGGLVIDLSAMRGVRADRERRLVRVQGGATLGDLDHEAQAVGLVVPAGIVSTTGVAGLALGGGIGWLARTFGLTCDQLVSADVVTAGGDVVTASAEQHADLLWGIRGGGGNFGVVTSFEFRAHDLAPVVFSGLLAWPLEQAPEVLRFYRDFAAGAPDELGGGVVMRIAPPAPFIPQALHGRPIVAIVACYAGPVEEGERVLRPLRQFGPPALDAIMPKPFVAHQSMFDLDAAPGRRHYWKAHDLPGLSDDVIDALVVHAAQMTSPYTVVPIFHLGGAAGRVPEDATAYSQRDAAFAFSIDTAWEDPREDGRHIEWARRFAAAVEPHAMGVYVNFLGDEGEERVRAAYGAEKYERLAALKAKYDPTNFFRLNQNIRPARS